MLIMKPQSKRLPPIRKKKRRINPATEKSLSRLINESNLELHPMAREVSSSLKNYIINDDLSQTLSIESLHNKSNIIDKSDTIASLETKGERLLMPG